MTKNLQNKLNDTRLQGRIGHQFKQFELLKLALTHRSVSHKHNYERLEFLGDALLGMIVANYLYNTYPLENEGRLTRMRATLVRQEALGKIANDLQLSRSLILSTGELKSGGHHRESILADTVEAIIGAIYTGVDSVPGISKDQHIIKFEDGSFIEYNKETQMLTIVAKTLNIVADILNTGKIQNTDGITSAADITDKKSSMQAMRDAYNPHTHGNSPPPSALME